MRRFQAASGVCVLRCALIAATLGIALCGLAPLLGQEIHRNDFERNRTWWVKGTADVAFDETAHATSDQVAHEGQRSEYLQINAKPGLGSSVLYYYPTAPAPISEELSAGLWIKSNRPGIQLMARVVLPKEADPNSQQDRLVTFIRGDTYRTVGGWKHLEIGSSVALCKKAQQLMQAQLRRPINFEGAYIDRLILNVYGGQGVTDVWIDELEIGPVLNGPVAGGPAAPGGQGAAPLAGKSAGATKLVEFNGSHLTIDGKHFVFRGIRHTDTPMRALREAGFNALFVDYPWDPVLMKQAVDLGFWLVPSLPVASDEARFVAAGGIAKEVRSFPELDAVLFWNLGTALASEQADQVKNSAQLVSLADPLHKLGADAWDGLAHYSAAVNLLGVHRWPLMTAMELTQYKDWLTMRSRLAQPGTFLWTWIQTHAPDAYTQVAFGKPSSAGFDEPIGPQPEQVRLLTYLAVGSGFRGIGYWSDSFLGNKYQGCDRLLTVALLNQEMEFIEPMLSAAEGSPTWIDTSDPNVKAAVIWTGHGILVLPMWLGSSAQFVPGQAAVGKLTIVVPQVPPCFQAWEVTPGEVRGLHAERVPGGTKITLPEFGLTTALVFTSNVNLIEYYQTLCWHRRQRAAQYTLDLAKEELKKVHRVEVLLENAGHTLPDQALLMQDASDRIKAATSLWNSHRFAEAYREAQRALRPARILMRAQWDNAIKGLDAPVASPYAVSFYTLPKHWEFMEQIKNAKPAANMLRAGDFETVPGRVQETWTPQESTLDDVVLRAERVAEFAYTITDPKTGKPGPRGTLTAKEGKQFLLLEVTPKYKDRPAPKALERTYLAIHSPTVTLVPGTLVRVSGWMAIPDTIQASADGALFYDSAGGEPLAVRMTAATGWRQFTLYRRVPPSGMINVTVALTGLGRVAFDDIRIEPLVAGAPGAARPPGP
jgi:hypothetical protein